jgi:hypothetical protein
MRLALAESGRKSSESVPDTSGAKNNSQKNEVSWTMSFYSRYIVGNLVIISANPLVVDPQR